MVRDEEHAPPTIRRLNALMAAGYEIDQTTSLKVGDAIWLDHPAKKRTEEPTLILYSDGLVVGNNAANPEKEQLRLNPEEKDRFNFFVQCVPQPNFWESSQRRMTDLFVWGFMLIFMFIMLTISYVIVKFFIDLFSA